MTKALADCLRYNRWANLIVINACRGLTAEQLDTRAKHSSRSARDLLSHIVGSELTFVLRTNGRQNEGESRVVDTWPGFEVLREVAASSGEDLIAIAAGLDEDELVALAVPRQEVRVSKELLSAPRDRARGGAPDRNQVHARGHRHRDPRPRRLVLCPRSRIWS